MEQLIGKYRKKLNTVPTGFVRSLMDEIQWDARLIGIKGARGVGKTTLLLQYIKENFSSYEDVLYVSLDDIWFADNSLTDLADTFTKNGVKHLFLDEVHRYPNWSQEIKNIYDDHPELQVVFTGSSLLEIIMARADLSRRATPYSMQGLSFREYLNLLTGNSFKSYKLNEILFGHSQITSEINAHVRPIKHFNDYLESGYYPFFREVPELYHERINEVLNLILDVELPMLRNVDIGNVPKLRQLLLVIAESSPFVPNISKLSQKLNINRNTLVTYLHYLEEAGIIKSLYKKAKGISRLQKPDKILMENSNFSFALTTEKPEKGSLRETFFVNQVGYNHQITYAENGDFVVDNEYLVEIGGHQKDSSQLGNWSENKAFLALDDQEYGHKNKVPLWLFGFLY